MDADAFALLPPLVDRVEVEREQPSQRWRTVDRVGVAPDGVLTHVVMKRLNRG